MNTIKNLSYISILYLIIMTISLIILSCNEGQKSSFKKNSTNSSDSSPKKLEPYIDLKKLLEKKTDKDALTVQVKYDHYFKTSKNYKGFYINTILEIGRAHV